jgi:ribonuclease HI
MSTLYQVGEISVPVAFELVKKTHREWVFNEKKGRRQRKSPLSKNQLYREMLKACQKKNRIEFS